MNAIMLAATTAGAGHPAVSVLLGLGAVLLAGVVVAMAWNVHVRQIRLAGQLARRQLAGDLADLVIGPALGVVAEIEIGERAVPPRHVIVRLELERAREGEHRLAVLAGLGQRGAEIAMQQRVVAPR